MFFAAFGQDNGTSKTDYRKGQFYFYWGYNRSYFSKTNLHFTSATYDFTVYNIEASDRPSKFGVTYFNPAEFSIPQYNYRLGYCIDNHWSVSGGMDHMKYVVEPHQQVKISGVISPEASEKYAGAYLNQPVALEPDLLTFEHTNGFNLVSLDAEYLFHVMTLSNIFSLEWNSGIGGVWVVTKTDVRVMGDGLDNDFHVAGYTLTGKMGPRLQYKNKFFFLIETKGGYASLPSVLIKNSEPKIGDHTLSFIEYYFAAGINFRLKGKSIPAQKI